MKTLWILLMACTCAAPAAAQTAVATELPPLLKEKLEKARAAAEAKAARDLAAADAKAAREAAAAEAKAAKDAAAEAKAARTPAAPGKAAARDPKAAAPDAAAAAKPAAEAPPAAAAAAAAPPPVAADGSSGEPQPVAMKVEKCAECRTTTRKRVAVLPARVGSVAADAGTTPESLGQIVSDRLEALLNGKPELIVLGRGSLQGVLAEQDLGARGATNAELSPQRGRLIPAELLLQVTLDRVDVSQQVRKVASSNAGAKIESAQKLERDALAAQQAAEQDEKTARDLLVAAQNMKAQNEANQAQMKAQAQQGALSRGGLNLGMLASAIGIVGEQYGTKQAEENFQAARDKRADADRKLLQARQLKEQAERAASSEMTETTRTTATISLVWRAVDTLTGEMVAGDTVRLSDSSVDERKAAANGGSATETSSSSRAQSLVNKLIDDGSTTVAGRLVATLEKVPFRGRIVRVDRTGVILNVGKNFGVEVGDTFSVRRIDLSLVDPVTGRLLAGPGSLEGMIRVSEVSEQIAKAVVLQSAGRLARGDVLEWVGVYK